MGERVLLRFATRRSLGAKLPRLPLERRQSRHQAGSTTSTWPTRDFAGWYMVKRSRSATKTAATSSYVSMDMATTTAHSTGSLMPTTLAPKRVALGCQRARH